MDTNTIQLNVNLISVNQNNKYESDRFSISYKSETYFRELEITFSDQTLSISTNLSTLQRWLPVITLLSKTADRFSQAFSIFSSNIFINIGPRALKLELSRTYIMWKMSPYISLNHKEFHFVCRQTNQRSCCLTIV